MSGILAIYRFGRLGLNLSRLESQVDRAAWNLMRDDTADVWRGGLFERESDDLTIRIAQAEVAGARRGPVVSSHCVMALDVPHGAARGSRGAQSEVSRLLGAYRKGVGDFCDELPAEHAYVVWDAHERMLLAGCDPAGGRSLAYSRIETPREVAIVIATRALSILRHPHAVRQLDAAYVAHLLAETWAQEVGATPFKNVRRVPPGHMLRIDAGGMSVEKVERFASHRSNGPRDGALSSEELRTAIDAAVRDAASEATPCIALSGGLDSASIAAALARDGRNVDAFTIGSPTRRDLDESARVAALVAVHPSVHVREIPVDTATLDPPDIAFDDPYLVGGAMLEARRRLHRAARESGHTIVLDGEGGDELFAMTGALSDLATRRSAHRLLEVAGSWRRLRAGLWRQIVVPRFPPLVRRAWHARERRREHASSWLTPDFMRGSEVTQALLEKAERNVGHSFEERLAFHLGRPLTVGSTLAYDAARARDGLEAASPFLDRRVISAVLAAPPERRLSRHDEKPLLRNSMRDRLPPSILGASKDQRLYDHLVRSALSRGGAAERAYEALRGCPIMSRCVALDCVRQTLDCMTRRAADPIALDRILRFYAFSTWFARVSQDYGVSLAAGW